MGKRQIIISGDIKVTVPIDCVLDFSNKATYEWLAKLHQRSPPIGPQAFPVPQMPNLYLSCLCGQLLVHTLSRVAVRINSVDREYMQKTKQGLWGKGEPIALGCSTTFDGGGGDVTHSWPDAL